MFHIGQYTCTSIFNPDYFRTFISALNHQVHYPERFIKANILDPGEMPSYSASSSASHPNPRCLPVICHGNIFIKLSANQLKFKSRSRLETTHAQFCRKGRGEEYHYTIFFSRRLLYKMTRQGRLTFGVSPILAMLLDCNGKLLDCHQSNIKLLDCH